MTFFEVWFSIAQGDSLALEIGQGRESGMYWLDSRTTRHDEPRMVARRRRKRAR